VGLLEGILNIGAIVGAYSSDFGKKLDRILFKSEFSCFSLLISSVSLKFVWKGWS